MNENSPDPTDPHHTTAEPGPTTEPERSDLDALAADLERVDEALDALDRHDLDQAEALADSLGHGPDGRSEGDTSSEV